MKNRLRLIMGRNCISEVVKSYPERIAEVYTCQRSDDSLYRTLVAEGISINEVSKQALTQMVQSESHQSYVASVYERSLPGLREFLDASSERKTSVVVMLDSIHDPQNLGSILRASECFGADAVVYSKNRGVDVTPVVTKVSCGAAELVPIIKISNLADTMKQFQEAGYWTVTAEAGEDSKSIYDFDFSEKTLIILGSEGEGVQQIISKNADFHVQIPMLGQIDSLNVSQAAAVFLACYRRQHR